MLKNLTKNKCVLEEVGVHDCAPNETKNNKGRNYAPLQTQSAITLIALIITIIIMIILAGITINIAANGGLFQQARQAVEQTEMEKYREELEFELAQKQIEALGQLTLQDLIDAGYVNEQGEIEKEGYIYKIDEDLRVTYIGKSTILVAISPNGEIGVEQTTVTITVSKIESEVNTNELYYVWSISKTEQPQEEEWQKFTNGVPLPTKTLLETLHNHYLWVKAYDITGNYIMKISNPYCDADTIAPVVTCTLGTKTDDNAIINIAATDDKSGIVEIEMPDGSKTELSNLVTYDTTYTTTQNGTNAIKVKDAAGNVGIGQIEITGMPQIIYGINGIVPDIRDMGIPDGTHTLIENGETYKIKVTNFYNDVTYNGGSANMETTEDGPMVILKYHGNLTIGR